MSHRSLSPPPSLARLTSSLVMSSLSLIILCVGCSSPPPPSAPHHKAGGGFQNTYGPSSSKSLWRFLKMRLTEEWADHEAQAHEVPRVKPHLEGLKAPQEAQLTWLGHSCFLLQVGGVNVLTDPVLSERASPVSFAGPKRYTPAPLKVSELPPIHAVIISHNHYDHLDTNTIEQLEQHSAPLWLVPLANRELIEDEGALPERVIELDWWQTHSVSLPMGEGAQGEVSFTLTPAQHWSARGLFDRFEMLWGSWSVSFEGLKLYFAGDTGFQERLFKEIGAREGPFDVALLPIGAYAPRDFMRVMHTNPAEAVEIHELIKSERSFGMHWGTFPLTAEPVMEPVKQLIASREAKGLSPERFEALAIGQTVTLERRVSGAAQSPQEGVTAERAQPQEPPEPQAPHEGEAADAADATQPKVSEEEAQRKPPQTP